MFIFAFVAAIRTAVISAFNWCISTASNMIMSNLIGIPA